MKTCSVWKLGGKMMVRYLICSFLCLILIFSLSVFPSSFFIQLILMICSLVLTLSMIYQEGWEQGEHDINYIDRGMLRDDKLFGLKAGLVAALLPFFIWVLAMLSKGDVIPQSLFPIYRFLASPFYVPISWLCGYLKEIPATEKQAAIQVLLMPEGKDCDWWRVIVSLLPVSLVPLTAQFGYLMGKKRILLWEKIVYKTKESTKKSSN